MKTSIFEVFSFVLFNYSTYNLLAKGTHLSKVVRVTRNVYKLNSKNYVATPGMLNENCIDFTGCVIIDQYSKYDRQSYDADILFRLHEHLKFSSYGEHMKKCSVPPPL